MPIIIGKTCWHVLHVQYTLLNSYMIITSFMFPPLHSVPWALLAHQSIDIHFHWHRAGKLTSPSTFSTGRSWSATNLRPLSVTVWSCLLPGLPVQVSACVYTGAGRGEQSVMYIALIVLWYLYIIMLVAKKCLYLTTILCTVQCTSLQCRYIIIVWCAST